MLGATPMRSPPSVLDLLALGDDAGPQRGARADRARGPPPGGRAIRERSGFPTAVAVSRASSPPESVTSAPPRSASCRERTVCSARCSRRVRSCSTTSARHPRFSYYPAHHPDAHGLSRRADHASRQCASATCSSAATASGPFTRTDARTPGNACRVCGRRDRERRAVRAVTAAGRGGGAKPRRA